MKYLLATIGITTLLGVLFVVVGRETAPITVEDTKNLGAKDFVDKQGVPVYTDCNMNAPKETDFAQKLKTYKVKNEDNSLRDLMEKEKASLKGCEIAKVKLVGEHITTKFGDIRFEVESIEPIDGGVQIFARAWEDGVQVGFGADGTVDIERFRFFNPPVLVDDSQGGILIESYDEIAGTTTKRYVREDPKEAIIQALSRTISVAGRNGVNIITGKRGNTISTFYSGSGDGTVAKSSATWAGARDSGTGSSITTDTMRYLMGDSDSASSYTVSRAFFPIDTSGLPDGDTISAATFSIYQEGAGSGDRSVGLIQTSQTSPTALDSDDFVAMTINTPTEGATRVSCTSVGYKDFTLNASGRGWISNTGYTLLGTRMAKDIDNTSPGSGVRNYARFYHSEEAGSASDPVFVVTHSAPSATAIPNQNIIIFE
jgi:hypothetical protein